MHRTLLACLLLSAGANPVWAQAGPAPPSRVTAEDGINGLKADDPAKRRKAAVALGALGPRAKAAVPALAAALKDTDVSVRGAAALALGTMGSEARAAVPALAEVLKDDKDGVRHAALVALSAVGPEAKGAVPAVAEALRDLSLIHI